MKKTHAYAVGLVMSFSLFAVANYFHFQRTVTCYDCFFPYGLPFTLYREGGFAGGNGLVWSGILLDVLIVVASGMSFGFLLRSLFGRSL